MRELDGHMQILSRSDAETWCRDRGVRLTGLVAVELDPVVSSVVVSFESDSFHSVQVLIENLIPNWVDSPFTGGMVLIDRFAHWGTNVEDVGRRLLDLAFTSAQTAQTTFQSGQGLLFDRRAHADIQIALLTAIVAGWDAVVVPDDGDYAVELSHDGVATVRCRSEEIRIAMDRRLALWREPDSHPPKRRGDR